jgi:hypothetical protein
MLRSSCPCRTPILLLLVLMGLLGLVVEVLLLLLAVTAGMLMLTVSA